MVQVEGLLTGPLGDAFPNTEIKITALTTENVSKGSFGSFITSPTAEYSFPLKDGEYLIEVMFKRGKFTDVGAVAIVNGSGTYTLEELVSAFKKCEPNSLICPPVEEE